MDLWFPSEERIHLVHERILHEGGGARGVLRPGSIASALDRARYGPFTGGGSLWERAALLVRGIAQEHPFVDGNKRTAFEVASTFLGHNGFILDPPTNEAVSFMVEIATGEHRVMEIADWLRDHSRNV